MLRHPASTGEAHPDALTRQTDCAAGMERQAQRFHPCRHAKVLSEESEIPEN